MCWIHWNFKTPNGCGQHQWFQNGWNNTSSMRALPIFLFILMEAKSIRKRYLLMVTTKVNILNPRWLIGNIKGFMSSFLFDIPGISVKGSRVTLLYQSSNILNDFIFAQTSTVSNRGIIFPPSSNNRYKSESVFINKA